MNMINVEDERHRRISESSNIWRIIHSNLVSAPKKIELSIQKSESQQLNTIIHTEKAFF